MVVRCFHDDNVTHVEGGPDPRRDIEIISIEMALADLAALQKRLDKLEREARANPKLKYKVGAAKNLIEALENNKPARTFAPGSPEAEIAAESFLLTAKPLLYVANIDEDQIGKPGPLMKQVQEVAAGEGAGVVAFCGKVEAELAGLTDEEAKEFCAELGIERGGLDQLIVSAYDLLGLMTFLTAGEKEVRAWTINRGTKAPQAAGKIHSDIERGFIRAEIVDYDDYAKYKTMDALRTAGLVRSEGKEYVMREGDVVNFKFNV
jgi:GTP-binding protein YchF